MDTVLLREYMADDLDEGARVWRESWISNPPAEGRLAA